MIDLNEIALGSMTVTELEDLREDAIALLDRIQQELEWCAASPDYDLHRFQFREDGPVFYAEAVEDGVLINPALPDDFDNTPNEQRRPEERARWWLRPFIVINTWEQQEGLIRGHQELLRLDGKEELCRPDLDAYIEEQRASWFAAWPGGSRYEVRCLDGGAWDRSSGWGMFGTLAEALACVNARCA